MRWDDVRRVRLLNLAKGNAVQQLGWYRLVLDTNHGEKWLPAFRWHERGNKDHRLRLGDMLTLRKLDAAARVRSAPLIRAIEERGFAIETDAETVASVSSGFDLAQHNGLLALVAVFFAAGIYALIDALFIQPYLPLETLPTAPFLLVGALAAFAAWKLGQGAPRLERSIVGFLSVAACVAATYPAMLRLNAATAPAEAIPYVSLGGALRPRRRAPACRRPLRPRRSRILGRVPARHAPRVHADQRLGRLLPARSRAGLRPHATVLPRSRNLKQATNGAYRRR